MDFTPEELAAESREIHLGLREAEAFVACAVLRPLEAGVWKVRQVAVAPNRQGQGLGREIMAFAEAEIQSASGTCVELNAREQVVPFYIALGYAIEGERFEEISIPHRKMIKSLS
jgi:predicted GNAT family N-acyltransferase